MAESKLQLQLYSVLYSDLKATILHVSVPVTLYSIPKNTVGLLTLET